MSASQSHGLEIESRLREQFQRYNQDWLPSHLPLETEYTARFDVPGYSDPYGRGIPTSIKSAKLRHANALIGLADATRIADLVNFPLTRLLVALYQQQGDNKVFREVREYLVTGEEWRTLTGDVPAEALAAFNRALKLPEPGDARQVAREWKSHLAEQFPDSKIRWNPKIDSKGQRRLQCSVHLRDVEAVIEEMDRIRVFGSPQDPPGFVRPEHLLPVSEALWGADLTFPLVLHSPPRQRQSHSLPSPLTHCPRRQRFGR